MSGATEVKEGSAILTTYARALAEAGAAAHLGPREQLGERLIRTFLTFWEDPQLRPQLLEVFRSAITSEADATRMRDFMSSQLFALAGETLEGAPMDINQVAEILRVPPMNINAAAAQVWGVIMLRYVLEIEPMASASEDELVDLLAPTIQRYLGA
jgi:Tetracyclin repressor-like, C-terminal domain